MAAAHWLVHVRRFQWDRPVAVGSPQGSSTACLRLVSESSPSHQIVYNHQVFNDAESFVLAVRNGTIKRLPPRPDSGIDPSWSTRKRVGPQRDLDNLPGPRSVSFAGLRYRVDRQQQYISWMGWGLYLGFDRDMGMSLWDIRMKGERIAYEARGMCSCWLQHLMLIHNSRSRPKRQLRSMVCNKRLLEPSTTYHVLSSGK